MWAPACVDDRFPGADRAALDRAAAGHEPAGAVVYPLRGRGERFPFVRPGRRGVHPRGVRRRRRPLRRRCCRASRTSSGSATPTCAGSAPTPPARWRSPAAPPAAATGRSCAPTCSAGRSRCPATAEPAFGHGGGRRGRRRQPDRDRRPDGADRRDPGAPRGRSGSPSRSPGSSTRWPTAATSTPTSPPTPRSRHDEHDRGAGPARPHRLAPADPLHRPQRRRRSTRSARRRRPGWVSGPPARASPRWPARSSCGRGRPAAAVDRPDPVGRPAAARARLRRRRGAHAGGVARHPTTRWWPGSRRTRWPGTFPRASRRARRPSAGWRRCTTWPPAYAGQRILVVAHSTLIRLVVCAVLGVPLSEYRRRMPALDPDRYGHAALSGAGRPALATTWRDDRRS